MLHAVDATTALRALCCDLCHARVALGVVQMLWAMDEANTVAVRITNNLSVPLDVSILSVTAHNASDGDGGGSDGDAAACTAAPVRATLPAHRECEVRVQVKLHQAGPGQVVSALRVMVRGLVCTLQVPEDGRAPGASRRWQRSCCHCLPR